MPIVKCDNLSCYQSTCRVSECQQPTCERPRRRVTGIVLDPAGKVPVYNVTSTSRTHRSSRFHGGASCNRCDASVSGKPLVITSTDTSGRFVLENVPVGADIPLVMQIGKWRRKVTIPRH